MTHYSRAEWRARPARGRYLLEKAAVEGIALHWPAMPTPLRDVPAVMRGLRTWQDYHMDTHGWSDIAYQIAIDQAGNTYGLRGMRHRSGANGDQDVNERYGAFLLILATGEKPTEQMIRTTRRHVADFGRLFPNADQVLGHQDVRPEPTSCPGPAAMALIHAEAFTPTQRKEETHA